MEARIVIRNAVVPGLGPGSAVVVEGVRIAALLGPGQPIDPRPGDWDVDADGRLVTAGLVDCHAHLALGALSRLAGLPGRAPASLSDLRLGFRRRLEDRAGPEELEPLARAGALAALRGGATTAFDLVRGRPGAAGEALEAVARGVSAVGLRASLSFGSRGAEGAAEVEAGAVFARARAGDPRLRGCPGLDGVAEASEAALEAAAAHVPALGLHASVGEDEGDLAHAFQRFGARPVEVLAARKLLGPRTVVAHAGTAIQGEGLALAESQSLLAVAPRAAMLWGAPLPPLLPFAALGVRIGFGTGGLFPDLACEAVAALMAHRQAERNASAGAGLVARVAFPAAARLASETFGAEIGGLVEGAAADLLVVDWRPPLPLPDVAEADLTLLWAGAPIAWAIVGGEVRLREGRLLGADEAEIAARAREAAGRLLRSGG